MALPIIDNAHLSSQLVCVGWNTRGVIKSEFKEFISKLMQVCQIACLQEFFAFKRPPALSEGHLVLHSEPVKGQRALGFVIHACLTPFVVANSFTHHNRAVAFDINLMTHSRHELAN